MSQKTDPELVALARCGDKVAFSHLIKRHRSLAFGIARKMVGRVDIAQDLVQEALLQAYLSIDRLRDDDRFQSWFCGIVLNVCRSHIRHQKINFLSFEEIMGGMKVDADIFGATSPSPMKVAQEQELYNLVLEAVNSLSPKNRTTVLLFYFEQLTIYEISALLNSSVTAVKGRLHKSRKQLKERFIPLYLEDKRIEPMIQVTVADLIYLPIVELPNSVLNSNSCVAILWDEVNRRFLPIFVGIPSGEAIAQILTETSLTRPMTFQFMSNILQAANVNLKSVRVESLHEDIYYAIVSLDCEGQIKEVDARPSDAIALALLMNSPIYVNEAVMQEAAIQVPSDIENAPTGRGLSELMSYRQQKQQELKKKRQEEQSQLKSREENWETINNLTMKFLFHRDRL
ncbi:bifunctional nuclease domain-containing protein [Pleurocapsa sp. PCC 7319]|uniref:bifunctional nuclease domain-containing protein n=1 Tax=Pleurocapsa sp. PCC 7319 TaxID=118161 RepID=UPI000375F86D|nr:bifunctional nuclease domain-containing protein [Pleurocapsa sp. PCC 7319]